MASVLAPCDCRACGGPLLEAQRFAVCEACVALVRPDLSALCDLCGERLALEDLAGSGFSRQAHARCEPCIAEPPPFVRASALGAYDGMLRTLIRLHKFEGMEELAVPLGDRLVPVLEGVAATVAGEPLHVVPVPLFRGRRRYNQSLQIASAALQTMRRKGGTATFQLDADALRRTRPTESQSQLTPAQRRTNVRGAFAVEHDVSGWTVVLVDDVYTTGATAKECSRTLLEAGAAAVHVVTVARTQPDRVGRWDKSSK